jgi:hypothetical protein
VESDVADHSDQAAAPVGRLLEHARQKRLEVSTPFQVWRVVPHAWISSCNRDCVDDPHKQHC